MNNYTDISQSKTLANILPIESADMKWFVPADNEGEFVEEVTPIKNKSEYCLFEKITNWDDTPYIPCWSLAALQDILTSKCDTQTIGITRGGWISGDTDIFIKDWFISFEDKEYNEFEVHNNDLIEAIVNMFIILDKNKLL